MKVLASWPLAPCEGPTGIAYDRKTDRIFSGCSKTSVVVDAKTGKVVATIANGDRVDALGWDAAREADLHPGRRGGQRHRGASGLARTSTRWSRRCTTMPGAKTIAVDPVRHVAYLFQPECGPAPAPPAGAPPAGRGGRGGRGGPQGPIVAAWFVAIKRNSKTEER